jgi:zinc transport system permease protein
MIQFLHDIADNAFLVTGLVAGLLASLACGVIGPYVITRRIVFLSGAIAHMAVGGIGAALFLATMLPGPFGWLRPIHGATLAALGGAVVIGLIHQRVAERMDTLIGALWSI